nr:LET1 [Kluyveromyces lactis]
MSALLRDADLNDFISPGLACVKPAQPQKVEKKPSFEVEVGIESSEPEKVSISLQDCLACAGCITSSEEILLSKQSHKVFLEKWSELEELDERSLAVSISPQCRLSLADYYSMCLADLDRCFQNFMKTKFNAKYVVGTQFGRSISISRINATLKDRVPENEGPLLCSVCPGFVLYAEKTKPELIPHMLDVKSPQQITGNLLKQADPTCYHLSIMPCFDKKLEASREECEKEVDCVITPKQFVAMLGDLSIDFKSYMTEYDSSKELCPSGWDYKLHWLSNEGSSSGGYAYQYLLSLQSSNPESDIITIEGKNSDVTEYRLVSKSKGVIASSSEVYGFRNIQNLVRKLSQSASVKKRGIKVKRRGQSVLKSGETSEKTTKVLTADPAKTDFVEVMACPSGCINGGGLLNEEKNANRRKQLAQDLSLAYTKVHSVNIPDIVHAYDDKSNDFKYNLRVIEPSTSSDVVAVGNTW